MTAASRHDRAALDGTLGDQQHRHDGQDQDRALDEQARAVDRQRAADGGERGRVQREHGGQRAEQARDRQADLHAEPLGARHERLDEHADTRDAEHDQDRPQRVVGDRRRMQRCRVARGGGQQDGHFAPPTAVPDAGAGSVWWTFSSVNLTAGLMMSITGFG